MSSTYIDCWADNTRLVYDNETRTTRNVDGVETRIPGFGNTTTVEWLDPFNQDVGAYFHFLVEALKATSGYTRGENLHGAPYDFRKAASEYYLLDDVHVLCTNSKALKLFIFCISYCR